MSASFNCSFERISSSDIARNTGSRWTSESLVLGELLCATTLVAINRSKGKSWIRVFIVALLLNRGIPRPLRLGWLWWERRAAAEWEAGPVFAVAFALRFR